MLYNSAVMQFVGRRQLYSVACMLYNSAVMQFVGRRQLYCIACFITQLLCNL